jgi:hypothetical protein
MSKLEALADQMIAEFDAATACTISNTAREFIEVLTFAEPGEIRAMLRRTMDADLMGLPVWARNLAFRLATLQQPEDARLLRDASVDLHMFGPDWDDIAGELAARAERLGLEG